MITYVGKWYARQGSFLYEYKKLHNQDSDTKRVFANNVTIQYLLLSCFTFLFLYDYNKYMGVGIW